MTDYSLLNDPEMSEIFESFVVETKETLEKLDLDLIQLEGSPDNADLLNEIFRSFHTVKGTSGFLGLVKMQALTHRLEDILNKLRKGEALLNSQIMDGILDGYDSLGELLDVIISYKNEDYDTDKVISSLEIILKNMNSGYNDEDSENPESELIEKETTIIEAEEEVSKEEVLINFDELDEEALQKAFIANSKQINSESKPSNLITEV